MSERHDQAGGWDRYEVTAAAGTRVHAAALGPAGSSELVVCVHGLGCSHRYFRPLARALAPGVEVVALDLPGFGRTPAHRADQLSVRGQSLALADWLAATGRGGAVFVANSAGCQVVVDLATYAPELLGPAVLCAPTMDRHARSPVRQLARLLADVGRERPSLVPVIAGDYLRCGPRRLLTAFRHVLADAVEHKLSQMPTPTVVARGDRDPIVSHEWAVEVAALLPHGRLVEVPGAGHALNYTAPEDLARITRSLLPSTGLPRRG
ncbi:alpha/beta fold hydrolase [Actinophytocola sp.]|uniref:alpha/beta fold hydrolase n=1 Tax=Actinophytocola sp. TaxID=1872138 RepID=UPI003899FD80